MINSCFDNSIINPGGVIPDANMIHLARKRRQQAREMGGDDFIRVDDTVRCEKTSSRLIRCGHIIVFVLLIHSF